MTPPAKEMLAAEEEDKSKKDECKCCMCRKKREEEEEKEVWLVESVCLCVCVERGAGGVAGGIVYLCFIQRGAAGWLSYPTRRVDELRGRHGQHDCARVPIVLQCKLGQKENKENEDGGEDGDAD
jgi:hypothetical protein